MIMTVKFNFILSRVIINGWFVGYIGKYQWRLVTFQPGDADQKSTLHFLKFYFNLRFFVQISSNTALFSLFFKFIIRLKKIYLGTVAPNG